MIFLPSLLILAVSGVRVDVVGEGKLRFAAGRTLAYADHATLSRNAAGLLADETGRPVVPQIPVPSATFAIGMGGKVTVGSKPVGQLVLERPGAGGDFGYPGTGTFGLLKVGALPALPRERAASAKATVAYGKPLVQIHAANAIVGDRVRLVDIADIDGSPAAVARLKTVDLGATPALGCERTLMKYSVLAALRDQGFRDGDVEISIPPDARLARKSQTVDAERILDVATKAVDPTAKAGDVPFDMGPTSVVAEPGDVTFTTVPNAVGDRVEVTVDILVGGRDVGQRRVRFHQRREGVRVGDALRVTVEMNGATVETDAKAKTGGNVGETIQIVTAEGTTLTATVTGNGRVRVNL